MNDGTESVSCGDFGARQLPALKKFAAFYRDSLMLGRRDGGQDNLASVLTSKHRRHMRLCLLAFLAPVVSSLAVRPSLVRAPSAALRRHRPLFSTVAAAEPEVEQNAIPYSELTSTLPPN